MAPQHAHDAARRVPRGTRTVAMVLGVVLASGCTGPADDGGPTAGSGPSASPSATPTQDAPTQDAPVLAAAPATDGVLWTRTVGAPVLAAVRTSTPLARLADTAPADREATCRSVARELDGIAPLEALLALAVSADGETATLLSSDLLAKAELLGLCTTPGPALEAAVAEVAHTHAVAVRWTALLGGGA